MYSTAIADIDGDSKAELMVASTGYGDINTNARAIRFFRWDSVKNQLVEAGRVAIAAAIAPVQNPGSAGATQPPPEHNGAGAVHVSVADIDKDGIANLLVNWETWTENYAQLPRGKGGLQFEDVTVGALGAYKTNFLSGGFNRTILSQRFQDVNGDGFMDIVFGTSGNTARLLETGSPATAWINDGTGKFRKEQPQIDGGSPATGTIVKMFGGCKTCGYVSYYGRFVPRSDLSMSARRPLAG